MPISSKNFDENIQLSKNNLVKPENEHKKLEPIVDKRSRINTPENKLKTENGRYKAKKFELG